MFIIFLQNFPEEQAVSRLKMGNNSTIKKEDILKLFGF